MEVFDRIISQLFVFPNLIEYSTLLNKIPNYL